MATTIRVKLKDASQNVLHPETEWSLVLNKPRNLTTEERELVFGHYLFPYPSQNHTMIYPAVRIAKRLETPTGMVGGYTYTYYSFQGGSSWEQFDDAKRFIPGL